MRKRDIKTYEQYLVDYELSKDFDTTSITSDRILKSKFIKYERIYLDYLLMQDVIGDNTNESLDDVITSISRNDFDNDVDSFFESFNKSKRVEFLYPHTKEELKEFKLFKLSGYNIGFAIKKNGEITLVHNSEKIKGIGDILIKKCIELGGTKIDHFDGFLTGFYRRNGLVFYGHEQFDEMLKPKTWVYGEVDINDPNESVYVNELKVSKSDFINASIRYSGGKPDVIYRKVK